MKLFINLTYYVHIFRNNFGFIINFTLVIVNIICIIIKYLHYNLTHNNNLFSYAGGAFGLVAC